MQQRCVQLGTGEGEGTPTCGNGVVEDGEACDDGNGDPTDACDACVAQTEFAEASGVTSGWTADPSLNVGSDAFATTTTGGSLSVAMLAGDGATLALDDGALRVRSQTLAERRTPKLLDGSEVSDGLVAGYSFEASLNASVGSDYTWSGGTPGYDSQGVVGSSLLRGTTTPPCFSLSKASSDAILAAFATGGYTLMAWTRKDIGLSDPAAPINRAILAQRDDDSTWSYNMFIGASGRATRAHLRSTSAVVATAESSRGDWRGWQHHAVTFTPTSNTLSVYENGVHVSSQTLARASGDIAPRAASSNLNSVLRLGCTHIAGENYVGNIDEVGLWQRPLSDAEIRGLYENQSGSLRASSISPVLDLGTMTTVTGMSVTPRPPDTGTFPTTATQRLPELSALNCSGVNCPGATTTPSGAAARSFDGDDRIDLSAGQFDVNNLFVSPGSAINVCASLMTSTVATGAAWAFAFGKSTSGKSLLLGRRDDALAFGANGNELEVPGFFTAGTWRHVCVQYSYAGSGEVLVYADGILLTRFNDAWTLDTSGNSARIGARLGTAAEHWQGGVAQLVLWRTGGLNEQYLGEPGFIVIARDAQARPRDIVIETRTCADAACTSPGPWLERLAAPRFSPSAVVASAAFSTRYLQVRTTLAKTSRQEVRPTRVDGLGWTGAAHGTARNATTIPFRRLTALEADLTGDVRFRFSLDGGSSFTPEIPVPLSETAAVLSSLVGPGALTIEATLSPSPTGEPASLRSVTVHGLR